MDVFILTSKLEGYFEDHPMIAEEVDIYWIRQVAQQYQNCQAGNENLLRKTGSNYIDMLGTDQEKKCLCWRKMVVQVPTPFPALWLHDPFCWGQIPNPQRMMYNSREHLVPWSPPLMTYQQRYQGIHQLASCSKQKLLFNLQPANSKAKPPMQLMQDNGGGKVTTWAQDHWPMGCPAPFLSQQN